MRVRRSLGDSPPVASARARRLRGYALPVAALLAALIAIGAPPAAMGSGTVYYEGALQQPRTLAIKSHGYYRNVSVHGLQWTAWGAPQATAAGTFTYQFCVEESCSVAPFFDEPVVVTLSTIEHCRGRSSYAMLALQINGSMPDESFNGFRMSVSACPRRRSSAR